MLAIELARRGNNAQEKNGRINGIGERSKNKVSQRNYGLGNLDSQRSASVFAFFLKFHDFLIKRLDRILGLFNGGHQRTSLAFPSTHPFGLGASPTIFDFDLLAKAALCLYIFGLIHELHAARLAGTVFIVALVGETRPTEVPTHKSLLIVKAHDCCGYSVVVSAFVLYAVGWP